MIEQSAVQELVDKQAIQEALIRYCRGIDRGDSDMLASAYHPDAFDDHGWFVGRAADYVPWAIDALHEREQVTTHQLSNVLIEVHGDTASVESYFVGSHVFDDKRLVEVHGRYVDEFERRDGSWRISSRITVYDWNETRSIHASSALRAEAFRRGSRSVEDPSYPTAMQAKPPST